MIEPSSPKNALTKEEESAFFKFISESKVYSKWQNLFLFLVGTGLRAGEAFALTWDDVDFERNYQRKQNFQILQRDIGRRLQLSLFTTKNQKQHTLGANVEQRKRNSCL